MSHPARYYPIHIILFQIAFHPFFIQKKTLQIENQHTIGMVKILKAIFAVPNKLKCLEFFFFSSLQLEITWKWETRRFHLIYLAQSCVNVYLVESKWNYCFGNESINNVFFCLGS